MGLSQKDGAPDKGPALFQGPPPRFRIDIDGSLLRARLRHLRRAGPFDCPQPSRQSGHAKSRSRRKRLFLQRLRRFYFL